MAELESLAAAAQRGQAAYLAESTGFRLPGRRRRTGPVWWHEHRADGRRLGRDARGFRAADGRASYRWFSRGLVVSALVLVAASVVIAERLTVRSSGSWRCTGRAPAGYAPSWCGTA